MAARAPAAGGEYPKTEIHKICCKRVASIRASIQIYGPYFRILPARYKYNSGDIAGRGGLRTTKKSSSKHQIWSRCRLLAVYTYPPVHCPIPSFFAPGSYECGSGPLKADNFGSSQVRIFLAFRYRAVTHSSTSTSYGHTVPEH